MKTLAATLLVSLLLLAACAPGDSKPESNEPASLEEKISKATQVSVLFESGEQFDLTDAGNLQAASVLISGKKAPSFKCGTEGRVTWTNGGEALLSAQFNLEENCRYLAFQGSDPPLYRRLTSEGMDFLNGLLEQPAPIASNLSELSWILGLWRQSEAPGVLSFEQWEKASDTRFTGSAFTIQGNDTAYSETLELVQEASGIYYIPNIPSNDGPVRFKMTSSGPTSAVFENPTHDFPQMITYKVTEDTILHARISGTQVGKNGEEKTGFKDFFMLRVK